jgi:hypothetical protein
MAQDEIIEVAFALEGDRKPQIYELGADATVGAFLERVIKETGRGDLEEVAIEDAEEILALEIALAEILVGTFKVLHVAKKGRVKVFVTFNGQTREEAFQPSASMRKVTRWAISAFGLEGEASDFQLKHNGEVLPPETHVGQVSGSHKELRLDLVMKIKPQG